MDKQKAYEIITDGETNSLQSRGRLVVEPYAVIQLFFNGEEYHTTYGVDSVTEGKLDFAVHRAKSVSIGEQEAFYSENEVTAEVYTVSDDTVTVKEYTATPDGWTSE